MPTTGAVTRTVVIKPLMTDTEREAYISRQYPASMFEVHKVEPRKLTRPEIEHAEYMQSLYSRSTPLQREQLEQKLAGLNKPFKRHTKQFNFVAHKNKKPDTIPV